MLKRLVRFIKAAYMTMSWLHRLPTRRLHQLVYVDKLSPKGRARISRMYEDYKRSNGSVTWGDTLSGLSGLFLSKRPRSGTSQRNSRLFSKLLDIKQKVYAEENVTLIGPIHFLLRGVLFLLVHATGVSVLGALLFILKALFELIKIAARKLVSPSRSFRVMLDECTKEMERSQREYEIALEKEEGAVDW